MDGLLLTCPWWIDMGDCGVGLYNEGNTNNKPKYRGGAESHTKLNKQ